MLTRHRPRPQSSPELLSHLTLTKAATVTTQPLEELTCTCRSTQLRELEQRELADLAVIDSAVRRFERLKAGAEPWPVFQPPANLKDAA